jgi:hypothetical protein
MQIWSGNLLDLNCGCRILMKGQLSHRPLISLSVQSLSTTFYDKGKVILMPALDRNQRLKNGRIDQHLLEL